MRNYKSPAGSQNSQTSGGASVDGMCWSPESNGGNSTVPATVVCGKTKDIIHSPTQGSNHNFNMCTYATNVPQTPSSAPPIPILISTDEDDKTLKDIFFPPGFSSDISVVTAVQQQQTLSQKHPLSSVIISRQEGNNQYFRNSPSPASITKHLQSLRPVLCPSTVHSDSNKMEEQGDTKLNSPSVPQQIPLSSPSQNEFRISQLKSVSSSLNSAVSWPKENAVFKLKFRF